jgi:hypothetical protein
VPIPYPNVADEGLAFVEIPLKTTHDIDRRGQAEARQALNGSENIKPINETACGFGSK